jgi:hypothetical protein
VKDAGIMVTRDSDGQHNPDRIPELIEPLKQGYYLVKGSRYLRNDDKLKVP